MRKIKDFFNEETFNYKDIIVLGIIVLVYSIISFINLGTKIAPQTFYEVKKGEGIKLILSEDQDINKIIMYSGHHAGEYLIELSKDDNEYSKDLIMKNSGAFAWDSGKLNRSAKYIKLIPQEENLTLGEIALYDNDDNKIPFTITTSKKTIYKLTDEPSTIPERISNINSSYFDEVYFARSAYEYANHMKVYDWVHPPLGKIIQSIPIIISGKMAPFYYRLLGNIAGILMIVVMYLFGKMMFKKRKYATFAALLMTFDTFHFVQTRIGTIDSFLMLFILLEFFFIYRYIKYNKTKDLALTGVFFALATSIKWIGLWSGVGIIIIYILNTIVKKEKVPKVLLKILLFFVIIPVLIYISSYKLSPNLNNRKVNTLSDLIEQSKDMYNYHSKLEADHPYTSKWYTWPISYRPIWYYNSITSANSRSTIVGVGNILIWWPAILTFLMLPYYIIKKRNKKSLFLLITILSIYIPFIFIGRIMFIYHYLTVLPFMMLTIVNFFYQFNKNNKKDFLIVFYTLLTMIIFIVYYPVISGTPTNNNYIDSTKILSTWEY